MSLPTTGVVVLDVSVPSHPAMVPDASNPTGFEILRTPAMLRAYEGLRAQSDILLGSGQDRLNVDVYGISQDCLHPQFLSTHITPAFGNFIGVANNHGGWLSYDGKTFWGVPFVGSNILIEPNRVDVHAVKQRYSQKQPVAQLAEKRQMCLPMGGAYTNRWAAAGHPFGRTDTE